MIDEIQKQFKRIYGSTYSFIGAALILSVLLFFLITLILSSALIGISIVKQLYSL